MNDADSPNVLSVSAACVASYAHVDALVSQAHGRASGLISVVARLGSA